MKAKITATGSGVPSRCIGNNEMARHMDTSDEWIVSHTGIRSRHVADPGETSSELGYRAARMILERASLRPDDLDLILVSTSTPDYYGFPSTSCLIQEKLGAKNAGAFDCAAACTGFSYGLEIARGFIATGQYRNILVIGTETMSRIVDWTDRNTAVLFGDGAGGVLLTASDEGDSGILDGFLRADGRKPEALHLKKVPSGKKMLFDVPEAYPLSIVMDGRNVYDFAVKASIEVIQTLLERNGLSVEDLKYIVPHQANDRILKAASKRAKIPYEKFYVNIGEYANTSAATIPIALNEMNEQKLLSRGDIILCVGFGGGLTYGGNLIRW